MKQKKKNICVNFEFMTMLQPYSQNWSRQFFAIKNLYSIKLYIYMD